MPSSKTAKKVVRRSISLRSDIDSRIQSLANRARQSANRIVEELIETGLETKESEKRRFFALAERLTKTEDAGEKRRIKEELARMTFGS
jgi:hypothetical protein